MRMENLSDAGRVSGEQNKLKILDGEIKELDKQK